MINSYLLNKGWFIQVTIIFCFHFFLKNEPKSARINLSYLLVNYIYIYIFLEFIFQSHLVGLPQQLQK